MRDLTQPSSLLSDLRGLIEQARQHLSQAANSGLTQLHWTLGQTSSARCCKANVLSTARRFCRRCRQNWSPNMARGSALAILPGWCSSPRPFQTSRLSWRCRDSWAGACAHSHQSRFADILGYCMGVLR